ncbi:MAG: hypothetical protein ACI9R3_002380 [Verrucomicrobiales bacterium]|jgi:hypothetical protein
MELYLNPSAPECRCRVSFGARYPGMSLQGWTCTDNFGSAVFFVIRPILNVIDSQPPQNYLRLWDACEPKIPPST